MRKPSLPPAAQATPVKRVESVPKVSSGWKPGEVDSRHVQDDDPMVSVSVCYLQLFVISVVGLVSEFCSM